VTPLTIWFDTIWGRVGVPEEVVRKVVSTVLCPNPYWSYSRFLTREEVSSYLEGSEDPGLLAKVAKYVLFYAENMAFNGYLMHLALKGREEADQYLEWMMGLLKRLRELAIQAEAGATRELVWEMISLCLKYGLDPF